MNTTKLKQAKKQFDAAAKHAGDAAYAINLTSKGLSILTEALIELSAEVNVVKNAQQKARIKSRG